MFLGKNMDTPEETTVQTGCPNGHMLTVKSNMVGYCPVCKAMVCVPYVTLSEKLVLDRWQERR